MSVIGQHIKKYRTARGITQEQLGQLVGVSTQAVSKWECGGTPDAQTRPWARIMHDSNSTIHCLLMWWSRFPGLLTRTLSGRIFLSLWE